jgi:hypothetical protein
MGIFDFFRKKKEETAIESRARNAEQAVAISQETIKNKTTGAERLFSGYRLLATLDTRTCLVCGSLDGKVFDNPEPEHKCLNENCRCVILPVIKGMEEPLDDDERASMDGPVPASMTYSDWLGKQPAKRKREILGECYDRYKAGESLQEIAALLEK